MKNRSCFSRRDFLKRSAATAIALPLVAKPASSVQVVGDPLSRESVCARLPERPHLLVTAVRTETAKLIKYPGHDEWTELFDLKADPYELKNLARDAAHKELLAQLQAEYDRQAKLIAFQVPSFAYQPGADAPAKKGKKKGKK